MTVMLTNVVLGVMILSITLVSATPIKFVEDDESNIPNDMFKALRNVISTFGPHRKVHDNETKPLDLDIESSSAFAFGPDQMRKLIAKKMIGAEHLRKEKNTPEKEGSTKEHKKDGVEEKTKEIKSPEQIGCSDKDDCNSTSYCNKLTYTCTACNVANAKCSSDDECCEDQICNEETSKCQKVKDVTDDNKDGVEKKSRKAKSCTSASDCGDDSCCALNDNGEGMCQPYLKEGAECGSDPFTSFFASQELFPKESSSGLPSKCPCRHDLKCQKRNSFLFVDSSFCTKKVDKKDKKKSDHKSIIRITLRSSPLMRFHTGLSDDSDDLTSLLPKGFVKMMHKPPHSRGFTMKISSRRDMDQKPHKISSRGGLPFPFFPFPFTNPFEEQEIDDIKEGLRGKRASKSERHKLNDEEETPLGERKIGEDGEVKRKRKMVDNVAEEARASVHRAVDGIFDTIMKKISTIKKKYRD